MDGKEQEEIKRKWERERKERQRKEKGEKGKEGNEWEGKIWEKRERELTGIEGKKKRDEKKMRES